MLKVAAEKDLESSSRKNRLIDGILGHLSSFGGRQWEAHCWKHSIDNWSIQRGLHSIAELTSATHSASDAIGTGATSRTLHP